MPADPTPIPSTLLRLLGLPSGVSAVETLSAATVGPVAFRAKVRRWRQAVA